MGARVTEMATNYDDVVRQLTSFGLILDRGGLQVDGKMVRCKVEGDREKRGWYVLHEFTMSGGDVMIVGSYGMWRGNENNAQRIELSKSDPLTTDQRAALKRRLAEDRKNAELDRARQCAAAAARAAKMWPRLAQHGAAAYLEQKGVGAHDVRFTPNGSAVLTVTDATGKIHGLQFLRTAAQAKQAGRPTKEFWPAGVAKKGHFHLLGHSPHWIVLVAEGYATAASLYESTGFPVACAFDAGNLLPVAESLRRRYKRARILVCADDDTFTEGTPGITSASAAALAVNGAWIAPTFVDEAARQAKHSANGHKLTDFNDLHAVEGLAAVGAQVRARLSELRWDPPELRAVSSSTTGEGGGKLRVVEHLDALLERYSLVYAAGGAVFDKAEHCLLPLTDMRNLCIRTDLHKAWMEHPARDVVRQDEVGFDPAESDPSITCNLWAGWPTAPKQGKCDKLLELLHYMCSGERNSRELADWVLKWIAFPIQHPGAKMKTTIVVHGPQGTGKNLFFETVMGIYGKYGRILDQDALTDKHNDWASRKLFLIADEVVAQAHRFEVKNKLKTLITGTWVRINPKHIAAYDEANHVNLVFLSNEAMPVVLEEDDRRHCIIWTPPKLPPEFYAALHHHLLHLPLGDFNPGTPPPDTEAKRELVDLAQDSPVEFVDALFRLDIPYIRPTPGLTLDWYVIYQRWCTSVGVKPASLKRFVNSLERRRGFRTARKGFLQGQSIQTPKSMLLWGQQAPEGVVESTWLGDQIDAMKSAMADQRGGPG